MKTTIYRQISKFLSIIAAALFTAYPYSAIAVPAKPFYITVNQPDGSIFPASIQGDEFQGWIETVSGYTIVFNPFSKLYEYAAPGPHNIPIPSGIGVLPNQLPPAYSKGLRPPRDHESELNMRELLAQVRSEQGDGNGFADWTPFPVSGNKKLLVVLVNFADRSLTTTAGTWNSKIFDTAAGVKSVANYYKDNSYGKLTLIPTPHTQPGNPAGIVTVTIANRHPNCSFNNDTTCKNAQMDVFNAALAKTAEYVDFPALDSNKNSSLENSEVVIYFILAGYEAACSARTPAIWAHAASVSGGVTAGGVNLTKLAVSGELNDNDRQLGLGTIAHELGHQIGGLIDLYDINPDSSVANTGMGIFSLMAKGSWASLANEDMGATPVALDAWSRQYLGWSVPKTLSMDGSTVTMNNALSSQDATVKLINPTISSTQYFLAENRSTNSGWDAGMAQFVGVGGVLIQHVDITVGHSFNDGTYGLNDINDTRLGGHQGVVPVEATTACPMLTPGSRNFGCSGTLFQSGTNATFGPGNSIYWNTANSGLGLTHISAQSSSMTAITPSGGGVNTSPAPVIITNTTVSPGDITAVNAPGVPVDAGIGSILTVPSGASGAAINLPPPSATGAVNVMINDDNLSVVPLEIGSVIHTAIVNINGTKITLLNVTAGAAQITANAANQPLVSVGVGAHAVVISSASAGTKLTVGVDRTTGATRLTLPHATVASDVDASINVADINGRNVNVRPQGNEDAVMTLKMAPVSGDDVQLVSIIGGSAMVTSRLAEQPLLVIGAVVVTGVGVGSRATVNLDSATGITTLSVTNGAITLSNNAFAESGTKLRVGKLYAGEIATFNNAGKVSGVRLGTLAGNSTYAGDKRGHTDTDSLKYRAWAPQLDAVPTRYGTAPKLVDAIVALLRRVAPDLAYIGEQSDGALRFGSADGRLISALPIGSVEVDIGQPDGITIDAHGKAKIVTQGLTTRFSSSATDLPAFAASIRAGCPTCVTVQMEDGNLHVTNGNTTDAWVADWYASATQSAGGLGKNPDGTISHTIAGLSQTFHPAAGDLEAILAVFQALDPNAVVQTLGDGSILVQANGVRHTLLPNAAMQTQTPATHVNDAWWLGDDGRLYLKTRDGAVQGFTVR